MSKRDAEAPKDASANLPSWAIQRYKVGDSVMEDLPWRKSLVAGKVARVRKSNLGRYYYRVEFDCLVPREIRRLFRGGHSKFVRFEDVSEVWAINENLRQFKNGASM